MVIIDGATKIGKSHLLKQMINKFPKIVFIEPNLKSGDSQTIIDKQNYLISVYNRAINKAYDIKKPCVMYRSIVSVHFYTKHVFNIPKTMYDYDKVMSAISKLQKLNPVVLYLQFTDEESALHMYNYLKDKEMIKNMFFKTEYEFVYENLDIQNRLRREYERYGFDVITFETKISDVERDLTKRNEQIINLIQERKLL